MRIHLPPLFNHQLYPQALQAELLALGVSQSRPHLSILVATLVVFISWSTLSISLALTWLAGAIITAIIGFSFKWRYQHSDQIAITPLQLRQGEWFGLFYSGSVGLLWGCSSQLMLPGQFDHNLIITMMYLGVCAGAGSIAIFGLGHLLMGSIISAGFFIGRFPELFPQHWLSLAVMFSLYHFVILRTAWERSKIIVANIVLRKEKELLLEQQRLEVARVLQANQDKSAFLAAASHDLRQPVHALMLLGHALRLRLPTGEAGMLVERILEAGQALSDQFNNLMDLSRLEGGAYRLNYSHIALEDFMQRLCAAHRQVAAAKDITLKLRFRRDLQQQAVYSDVGLLGRILDNLIANAIKFSTANSRIVVTARQVSGFLCLGVHDQGFGIPEEQQQNIFKPYVQLDNPSRDRAKGIGLGLSIVDEATNLLGAQLTVTSKVGHGSHFVLHLSADMLVAKQNADSVMPPRVFPNVTNLQGRRLLLVEDDPMAASALITWAQNWGLIVEHYAVPTAVINAQQPDLILCDIRLPDERDGIDWLTDWLMEWPDARGLLLSGELLTETHQRAEQEGLLLLSKPVDPDMLLQTLSGMLR